MFMQELLEEGYEYIFTGRLQSNPLERRFFQYRQIVGFWWATVKYWILKENWPVGLF